MGCKNSSEKNGAKLGTKVPAQGVIKPGADLPLPTLPDTPIIKALQEALPDILRCLAIFPSAEKREYRVLLIRKAINAHVQTFTPKQLALLFQTAATKIQSEDLVETVTEMYVKGKQTQQNPTLEAFLVKVIQLWTDHPSKQKAKDDVRKFLHEINPGNADLPIPDSVTFSQYYELVQTSVRRNDLDSIFDELTAGKTDILTEELFTKFIKEYQCEQWSKDQVNLFMRAQGPVTRYVFSTFFGSYTSNSCVAKTTTPPGWDDQPLHTYFVNSSFHTYLTGDQVHSASSIDMFRYVLLEGCRCLELEIWDGPDGSEPVVFHGIKKTTPLSLARVLNVVKENAFSATKYPVILSLDVYNTTLNGQRAIASLIMTTFNGMLADGLMFSGAHTNNISHFTPKELSGKILIKCKQLPIKPFVGIMASNMNNAVGVKVTAVKDGSAACTAGLKQEDWVTHVNGETVASLSEFKARIGQLKVGDIVVLRRENITEVSFVLGGVDDSSCQKIDVSEDEEAQELHLIREKSFHVETVVTELSHIATLNPVKCRKYTHIDAAQPWEVVSQTEHMFKEDIAEGMRHAIIEHNAKRFCRVYPGADRADSSNLDPILPWACGVQFVSMNWQTKCENLRLYRSLFRYQCQGSGYVPKPKYLMSTAEPTPNITLTVKYLGVHCVPVASGSSIVIQSQILMFENSSKLTSSPPIPANNWNTHIPNGFQVEFQNITLPHVSFLRTRVVDINADGEGVMIAESVLPLSVIRPGYRVMQLWDEEGSLLDHDSTLFCNFNVKTA